MRTWKIDRDGARTWVAFRVGGIPEAGQAVAQLLQLDLIHREVTWLQVNRRRNKGRAVHVNICWTEKSPGNVQLMNDAEWITIVESALAEISMQPLGSAPAEIEDDADHPRPMGVR